MNVAELSELYQKALKVKDETIRGSVAQALAEATVVKSSLAAASHSTEKSELGDALATRALAEVDQIQKSANTLLSGRATGAAAQAVAAHAISAEAIAAEALSAETVGAEPLVAEPFVAEPFAAEPFAAEPFAAEPFAAEPFVAEPFGPRNVKAGGGK